MFGHYNAVKIRGPNDIKNVPGHSPENPIDVDPGNVSFGIIYPYGAAAEAATARKAEKSSRLSFRNSTSTRRVPES